MSALERVAAAVPDTRVRLADLANEHNLSPAQAQAYHRFMGFNEIASAGTGLGELLADAARAALAETDPATVRYLVYAHTMSQTAPLGVNLVHELREQLGLRDCVAFSMTQQNCATGLSAIALTARLLARTQQARALVVTGEKVFSPAVRFLPGVAVVGDGAGACLVGPRGDELLAARFTTRGEYHLGVAMLPQDERLVEFHHRYAGLFAETIAAALAEAGLGVGEVALVVPQNVNRMSWKAVGRELGVPPDRVYLDTLPRIGHLNCSDPLVNLVSARHAGRLAPGDNYVLAASGIGAVFAALVLRAAGGDPAVDHG